jgi:hypothetical protein
MCWLRHSAGYTLAECLAHHASSPRARRPSHLDWSRSVLFFILNTDPWPHGSKLRCPRMELQRGSAQHRLPWDRPRLLRSGDAPSLVSASIAAILASGMSSCSSPKFFPISAPNIVVMPVMLPPGRFMLATRPARTGSVPTLNTIGICEARICSDIVPLLPATPATTRMPTRRRVSAVISAGTRSSWPSAKRYSIAMF